MHALDNAEAKKLLQQNAWAASKEDGSFQMNGLAAEAGMKIEAIKIGFARRAIENITISQSNDPIIITLDKESSVAGIVLDKEGAPLKRVNVAAVNNENIIVGVAEYNQSNFSNPLPLHPHNAPTTDWGIIHEYEIEKERVDGRFHIQSLPSGQYRLYAVQAPKKQSIISSRFIIPPKIDFTKEPHATINLSPGQALKGLELKTNIEQKTYNDLREMLTISGTVKDEHGNPLAKAKVQYEFDKFAISNSSGKFTLTIPHRWKDKPAETQINLITRAQNYGFVNTSFTLDKSDNVEITLVKDKEFSGQIIDALTRQPIQAFYVGLCSTRLNNPIPSGHMTKYIRDTEAEFTIAVPVKEEQGIIAKAAGYSPAIIPIDFKNPSTDPITVELSPGAIIEGTVLAPDGSPVPSANIQIYSPAPYNKEHSSWVPSADSGGKFIVPSVPLVVNKISAEHRDLGYVEETLKLEAGSRQSITLHFSEAKGGLIEGYLRYNGKPLSGKEISISVDHNQKRVQTDQNGYYKASSLKFGPAEVTAQISLKDYEISYIYKRHRFELAKDEHVQKDFDIPAFNTHLTGKVKRDETTPNNLRIFVNAGSRNEAIINADVKLDTQGNFSIKHLPPGKANLYVDSDSRIHTEQFTLTEGTPTHIEIDLGSLSTIQGIVKGPENLNTGNVKLYSGQHTLTEIESKDIRKTYQAYIRSGAYSLSIPKPGTYTIVCTIESDDYDIAHKTLVEVVTVEKNDTLELNFEF